MADGPLDVNEQARIAGELYDKLQQAADAGVPVTLSAHEACVVLQHFEITDDIEGQRNWLLSRLVQLEAQVLRMARWLLHERHAAVELSQGPILGAEHRERVLQIDRLLRTSVGFSPLRVYRAALARLRTFCRDCLEAEAFDKPTSQEARRLLKKTDKALRYL